MTIGTVPEVLDLLQVSASGIAAKRLYDFLATMTSTLGSVTNPLSFKGTITVANTFPLIADVENGWFYRVTADVTDNGGSTYTNTSQSFLAEQEIAWNGTNWTIVGDALVGPFQFKGNIANAAGFPPPVATLTTGVKDGHVYRCTAGVTDNDGAKTNTRQIFLLGDIIVWQTSAWYIIQKAPSAATPAAIGSAGAGTSGRPSNDDHAHAHGNQLGGTLHAAAVASTSDGFMTGAMAATLASAMQAHGNQLGGTLHAAAVASTSDGFMTGAMAATLASAMQAHGNQLGGTLHAAAVASTSDGFMTGAMAATLASAMQAHGNQLGGTLHADAVASTSAGFLSGADKAKIDDAVLKADFNAYTILAADSDNTPSPLTIGASTMPARLAAGGIVAATVGQIQTLLGIDAIVDDHVYAKASTVDIMADESEITAVLTGDAGKHFIPTHLIIKVATVTGTPATPGAINIGTSMGGIQIASNVPLTGLILVGDTRQVPLAAATLNILGNATLYVNVESAEAVATVLTCDVWVKGRQV